MNRWWTLTQVDSIVFDQWEFPVDGSPAREAELDPRLRPFLMDPPSPVYDLEGLRLGHLSLRQLCERLGAEYRWDEDSQTAHRSVPRGDHHRHSGQFHHPGGRTAY